jgi:copper(I)-binding protein
MLTNDPSVCGRKPGDFEPSGQPGQTGTIERLSNLIHRMPQTFQRTKFMLMAIIRNTLLLAGLLMISPFLQADPLAFVDAYIPEAAPGAQGMSAYMSIVNKSDKNRSIIDISSQEFDKVEMQRPLVKNGKTQKQTVEALHIPANGSLNLKPDGTYLALLEPKKEFMHGELIILYLTEADGTEHTLVVSIKKPINSNHHHE